MAGYNLPKRSTDSRNSARIHRLLQVLGRASTGRGGQLLADLSNQLKLPHFTGHHTPSDLSDYPDTVRPSGGSLEAIVNKCTDFVIQQLRAKSIALLADNQTVPRDLMGLMKQRLAAAGVTVTSEQDPQVGTTERASDHHAGEVGQSRCHCLVPHCWSDPADLQTGH